MALEAVVGQRRTDFVLKEHHLLGNTFEGAAHPVSGVFQMALDAAKAETRKILIRRRIAGIMQCPL